MRLLDETTSGAQYERMSFLLFCSTPATHVGLSDAKITMRCLTALTKWKYSSNEEPFFPQRFIKNDLTHGGDVGFIEENVLFESNLKYFMKGKGSELKTSDYHIRHLV
jgi:hypothetical protein